MSITQISPQVVKYVHLRPGDLFGVDSSSPEQVHAIGYRDAPLYGLQQPFAADDGWEVFVKNGGRRIARDELPFGSQSESGIQHSLSVAGAQAIAHLLPKGTYFFVQCTLPINYREPAYVGNLVAMNSAPLGVLLGIREPVNCFVVHPEGSTITGQCLLGVVILHSSGVDFTKPCDRPHQHSVVFFPFAEQPSATEDNSLYLILPATGELILDNQWLYAGKNVSNQRNVKAVERWREYFVPQTIAKLSES